MEAIISVQNLAKIFKGDIHAVKRVSFHIEKGEIFAFLGPNGAGKSTTVKMLTTLLKPTSGKAVVAGFDVASEPEKIRKKIGVALQETGIDPGLTGYELLNMHARLFGFGRKEAKMRTEELLSLVHLEEAANRKCGNYSGGMRRRLDLALTLIHRPQILFLDEPTTGLDPTNRKIIWEEIRNLNKENGTTIFLTTQYLEEADQLADRISIINDGRIVLSGTPNELKSSIGHDVVELYFQSPSQTKQAAELFSELTSHLKMDKTQLKLFLDQGTSKLPEIVRKLDQNRLTPSHLNVSPPTLDDVFLNVTGTQFHEEEKKKKEGAVT